MTNSVHSYDVETQKWTRFEIFSLFVFSRIVRIPAPPKKHTQKKKENKKKNLFGSEIGVFLVKIFYCFFAKN